MRLPRLLPIVLVGAAVALLLLEGWAAASRPPTTPGTTGRSANYTLDDYRTLLERTRGAVAVASRRTHRPHASGVLLAPDLVLTCRHATHLGGGARRRVPTSLEVQVEVDGRGAHRAYPVVAYAHTSEALDLCVLRLDRDARGRLPEADRIQVLSPARVPLGAPLYVLHHPHGGGLRVADDARVLFPFEATAAEMAALEARLRAEATRDGRGSGALAALRASYRGTPADDLPSRCFSQRWAGQPVLGADCATHDGSSGGPVYAKRTHALAGILFAGTPVPVQARTDTWQDHEAILPSAAILGDFAESADPAVRRLALASGSR